MRPTLKEIARRSGVSIATVSRVLNSTDSVREQVKEKVWKVARELGYRPARSFRKRVGKGKVIALMITDIANPFFPEIVHGVEDAVFEHGFSVSLWNTREDPQREEHYLRTLNKENVKGIIFGASRIKEEYIKSTFEKGIPCVTINRIVEGVPHVVADYEEGAYLATRYLLYLGHDRIALINGPANAQTSKWREKGFRKAFAEQNKEIDERLLSFNPPLIEGGYVTTLRLLKKEMQPSAILAYNDLVALGAMKAIKESGLSLPRDISLIGYDNIFLCAFLDPPLTTVEQPKYLMGRLAADMLFRMIERGSVAEKSVRLKPQLIIRGSCGVRG
ncbi:MAG: LacI family transcriptional regulator [Candidatus Atribacteria bacterium]|nr:LacI family transcriptional regulator [Candidatus Atribacteria bacterium]